MKGTVTIDFEDGTKQVFDCITVEWEWVRNGLPYIYSASCFEPIGTEAHTASIIIKGTQEIALMLFKEKDSV